MNNQTGVDVARESTTALTQHRKSLPALTGIRFFAAIQVVMFHFGAGFAARHGVPTAVHRMLANGWTAVTLFFILSGFILTYTYCGQTNRRGSHVRFWEARFARIYPVYLLALLLCLPARAAIGWKLSLAALCMVQAWNPLHPNYGGAWNMPSWSLSVEAFFYLLFPFLLPVLERLSLRALKTLALLIVLVIVLGHTMTPSIDRLTSITFLPLPVFRLPEFLIGMLTGLIFLRSRPRKSNALALYGSAGAILAILLIVTGPWISLLAIPFTFLIYNLAVGDSWIARPLGAPPLLLLGGASYSIYLLQEPVRYIVHFAFTHSWDLQFQKREIGSILSPIVLVLFSIAVFLYWEEPSRKWLRAWFKKRAMRKVPIAA